MNQKVKCILEIFYGYHWF